MAAQITDCDSWDNDQSNGAAPRCFTQTAEDTFCWNQDGAEETNWGAVLVWCVPEDFDDNVASEHSCNVDSVSVDVTLWIAVVGSVLVLAVVSVLVYRFWRQRNPRAVHSRTAVAEKLESGQAPVLAAPEKRKVEL